MLEGLLAAVLHHEVDVAPVFEFVDVADDVRVAERLDDLDFRLDCLFEFFGDELELVEGFDGYELVALSGAGRADHRVGPFPEFSALDYVVVDTAFGGFDLFAFSCFLLKKFKNQQKLNFLEKC